MHLNTAFFGVLPLRELQNLIFLPGKGAAKFSFSPKGCREPKKG